MIELEAFSVFTVTGRGLVYTVSSPYEMSRSKPEIKGTEVTIHYKGLSVVGTVSAVERYCLSEHVPIRTGEQIGLLLK